MSTVVFEGVRRTFGDVVAVDRIDLKVERGTFVGLIGHNGAGKSTALRMLMGLLQPTEGRVLVDGHDVVKAPKDARRALGAVPEEPSLYDYLTAHEHLEFVAEVRGNADLAFALSVADLGADADRLIREYSQGMRRKVALAAAVLCRPPVLVLDEALNSLDPPSAVRVKGVLRDLVDRGTTVILSTHVVETVAQVADRVIMMAHGRIVADESAKALGADGLERMFMERLQKARDTS
jgi:ABC-2 type transport system ATP-binding protein